MDTSQSNANFGTSTQVRIDGSPVVTTYFKFNVTGITGTVTSATLRVYANSAQSLGYTAYKVVDTTWGETTITAANAPALGSALGSSGKLTANTWTSANVTAAIPGNGLYTIAISTTNSTAVSLSSREGANPPQLVVNWSGSASAVPPIGNGSGDSTPPPVLVLLSVTLLAPSLVVLGRRQDHRRFGPVGQIGRPVGA